MAIEVNGKIYRNLQEQVLKNKEDIEVLQEGGGSSSGDCLKLDGTNTPTNDISWGGHGLVEVSHIELNPEEAQPTDATDIYKNTAEEIHVTSTLVAEFGIDTNGMPITGVPNPTDDDQAANKAYVDANAGGGSSSPVSLYTTVTFWETGSALENANITSATLYPSANMLVIVGTGVYLAADSGVGDNYITVECSDLVGSYAVITGILQGISSSGDENSTIVGRATLEYWDPDGVTLYNLGTQSVGEHGIGDSFVLTLFLVKL